MIKQFPPLSLMKKDTELEKIWRDLWASLKGIWLDLRETVLGYLVIYVWYLYYKYIRLYAARYLTRVLMVLAGLEFVVLSTEKILAIHLRGDRYPHWAPHIWIDALAQEIPFDLPTIVVWTSVGTLITASIVFAHHHLMAKRVEQHLEFLDVLREITAEATRLVVSTGNPEEASAFVERVLQALVETTMKLKGKEAAVSSSTKSQTALKRISTLMQTEPSEAVGWCFRIKNDYYQWPHGTYDKEVKLPKESAAGIALKKPKEGEGKDALIYIPWTRFPHGTRHSVYEKKPRIEYVPGAYIDLGTAGEPIPKSLICTERFLSRMMPQAVMSCA